MSTIADDVFNRLKAGEDPTRVRASVSSGMQFDKGLQRYVLYAQAEATRLQGTIASQNSTQRQLGETIETMLTQKKELDQAIVDLKNDRAGLKNAEQEQTRRLNEINESIRQTEPRLRNLQGQVQRLMDRGYTDELVSKLLASDAESGREMLRHVQTLERYNSDLLIQQSTLKDVDKKVTTARGQLEQLQTELQNTRNDVAKVGNRLLQRQEEEQAFEASLKITKALMETYGLSGQDFDNMWSLVGKFGAERLPGRTMANMKTAFQHYPTLLALETGVEELESRQKHLKEATDVLEKVDGRVAGNRYLAAIVALINGHWIGLDPILVVKASKEFVHELSYYVEAEPYFKKKYLHALASYLASLNTILAGESILIDIQSR